MVQYWRAAGLTYLRFCQVAGATTRQALKEPMRAKALKGDGYEVIRREWSASEVLVKAGVPPCILEGPGRASQPRSTALVCARGLCARWYCGVGSGGGWAGVTEWAVDEGCNSQNVSTETPDHLKPKLAMCCHRNLYAEWQNSGAEEVRA